MIKSAKLFLSGMYLHLLLSFAVPMGIMHLCSDGWNSAGIGLLVFYAVMICAVNISGWVCAGMAIYAYRRGKSEELRRSLKLLKLGSIPFYLLNFAYSFAVWGLLVGASRGMMFFLVPIPVFITCLMIFQSGCVGICYVKCLRNQPENGLKPSGVHYIMQLVSVLDIISTAVILRKYKRGSNTDKTAEPNLL